MLIVVEIICGQGEGSGARVIREGTYIALYIEAGTEEGALMSSQLNEIWPSWKINQILDLFNIEIICVKTLPAWF